MNWIEVLAAGVCGGVGGGLGALLAKALGVEQFGSKAVSARQAFALLPLIVGGVLGAQVLGPVATDAWEDWRARTPSQKFWRANEKVISSNPEILAWARAMHARGLSREQVQAEGAKGVARLSDADLLARTRLLGRGTGLVDVHTCATFARGSGGNTELSKLLDALGESDAQELATIVSHVTLAQVRQTPAARPQTTEDDVTKIFQTVSIVAGEDAVTAVRRIFADGASDDEVCSGARVLYDVLPRADAHTQQRLAMMLAGL